MYLDVAEREKRSIYTVRDSTTTRYMFDERRDQIYQSWNVEGFSLVDQEFLMCGIIDPYK